ncbi:MAG: CapA family protein [bacterium]
MRKTLFIVFVSVVAAFIDYRFFITPQIIEISPAPSLVSLALVGDIMLDRGVELKIKNEGANDFRFPFLKIADELKKADVVFGNLESPISDQGEKIGSIYSFRADPKAIDGLIYADFNVVSLANNHALDYGRKALEDTYSRLEKAAISYAGGGMDEKQALTPIIKQINNTKIGFLAYTNLCQESWRPGKEKSGINCVSENDLESVRNNIKNAKEKTDILIVSLHAGEEYTQKLTAFQEKFAKTAIDSGADIVVGHHPHVVQKNERYKDGYIFYSLGNFVFDQSFSKETMQGQIVKVSIENKKIKEVIPVSVAINENFQPEITASEKPPSFFQTSLSSSNLKQGDTLLVKITNSFDMGKINGKLGQEKINFFEASLPNEAAAILGIDAKKTPGNYSLVINFPNDSQFKKTLTVAKASFPITELAVTPELEEKGFTPTNIAENIAKNDGPTLHSALAKFTPQAYFSKPFIYPLKIIKDVGAFGNIRKSGDISLQHLGVDLDAKMNTPVYAANDGAVALTYDFIDYGKTIIIDHGLGIFSLYLHLDKFNFSEGQKIKQGDIVGLSGNTGYSIAPHLHFSIKLNGASVNPINFVKTLNDLDE